MRNCELIYNYNQHFLLFFNYLGTIMYDVCLICTHPNPATHFVEYVQVFEENKISYEIIAGADVAGKFSEFKDKVFVIQSLEALEEHCKNKKLVISDISTEILIELFQRLEQKYPSIQRAVLYDNNEKYVGGGYTETARKIIPYAQMILFANANLAKTGIEESPLVLMDVSKLSLIPIGHIPMNEAKSILSNRQDAIKKSNLRAEFFQNKGIVDKNQKIYVYVGGANDTYYEKAFPAFLDLLLGLKNSSIFLLQQHPRAKEASIDVNLLLSTQPKSNVFVSNLSTIESLTIADGVLYYQTNMAAQFPYAGIPWIAQIGHETYDDVLIRSGIPSITNSDAFEKALSQEETPISWQRLEQERGVDSNWKQNLLNLIYKK